MKLSKKQTLFRNIALSVLALAVILYLLADRFLIERVEIANVNQNIPVLAASPEPLQSTPTFDDWNYHTDSVSIAIKKVAIGSGTENALAYYVADVVLADTGLLTSAFAKNEFGRNIIEDTSKIAADNDAIFAINGDYYGFRRDGILIRNGVVYRDQPARVGLAIYKDGSMKIYDETQTNAQQLLDEGVWHTLSFGPALIEDGVVENDFQRVAIDHNVGNHTIQGPNPRTGIGLIANNHFVFVVVDGRSQGYSRGIDLTGFANIFKELGCTQAYNLDGGGSSTMVFMGRLVNNPLGINTERGTSDILLVRE